MTLPVAPPVTRTGPTTARSKVGGRDEVAHLLVGREQHPLSVRLGQHHVGEGASGDSATGRPRRGRHWWIPRRRSTPRTGARGTAQRSRWRARAKQNRP